MANENVEVARDYHERTKHTEERLRASPHHLDWENQPVPFKLYRDLETIPLPRQLEPGTVSTLRHLKVLHADDPHHAWEAAFRAFARALRVTLASNPWRAGLTAGVKGTLD